MAAATFPMLIATATALWRADPRTNRAAADYEMCHRAIFEEDGVTALDLGDFLASRYL
jgi:hypothetical protein